VVLLAVLTGLLAVVAVASRLPLSSHAVGSGAAGAVRGTVSVLALVAAVAGVVLLVVIASFFRGVLRRRSPDDDLVAHQPPIPAWKALPWLPLLVAFALAAVVMIEALGGTQIHPRAILGAGSARTSAVAGLVGRPAGESGLQLPTGALVAAAGLVGLLLAMAVAVGLRASRSRGEADVARGGPVEAVLDEAIAELVSGPGARRAVIGAYVRMERALAARALAHRASEAPREYLARARAAIDGAGESAARLTELFEEAKFSPHEISEPMRQEALAALRDLRRELGAER
jgi:hypothetical protein